MLSSSRVSRSPSPMPRDKGNQSNFSNLRMSHQEDSSRCIHTITQSQVELVEESNSVLSLAANDRYLFTGSQGAHIHVWSLETFIPVTKLRGHKGSILGLTIHYPTNTLFSSSGDGTVRVWDVETFDCKCVVIPAGDVGDAFAVVYSEVLAGIAIGCQNTSIQWLSFLNVDPPLHLSSSMASKPSAPQVHRLATPPRPSKFFQKEASPPAESDSDQDTFSDIPEYEIPDSNMCINAHDGYVYALALGKVPGHKGGDGEVLFSGSGDGDLKLWSITSTGIEPLRTLRGDPDSGILSLALDDGYLFCGAQGGDVKIWDLETFQLIRSLTAHDDDVLAVTLKFHHLLTGSADGTIKRWDRQFECIETWDDHDGIVLSLTELVKEGEGFERIVSGGSDGLVKIWEIPQPTKINKNSLTVEGDGDIKMGGRDMLIYTLERWISIRTISGDSRYFNECRRGAKFLKTVLKHFGAEAVLLPGAPGRNPLVFGRFRANAHRSTSDFRVPRILFYGHYDVIPADAADGWHSDPFRLEGRDGYLYGRGITDNKGPVLAAVMAVSELLESGDLNVDVIFLVEGEEESGSIGFLEAIRECKDEIGAIDVVLLSNSYWLGENVPCLTYGLRGVIHASLEITSAKADLHSGVEGGAVSEPLIDMVKVLARLVDDDGRIAIPGFYDNVRPVTDAEEALYTTILEWMNANNISKIPDSRTSKLDVNDSMSEQRHQDQRHVLMARWRFPTLTIHKIDVSLNDRTIIPRQARAAVSMRIVPDQRIPDVISQFEGYVKGVFAGLTTKNQLEVEIKDAADWWLGSPEDKYFKAAEKAIEEEWGVKPLYIREGGSIPAVRWLEREFGAVAVHLPMGQSSDQAHLSNERIRLQNLNAGKRILRALFKELGEGIDKEENNESGA